jgi:branched-chain amino acid transport system substrate-binding protein
MRNITRAIAAGAIVAAASIASARADAPSVVNIGFTGPLSGGAAAYGADVQRGLDMAINEINAAGGVSAGGKKYTLKLDSLDDAYRPNEAATNAKRLAQQDNAPIIFCPHSGGILAIMGFNEKQSPKFVLGAYSSEPTILKQGDGLVLMIPPRYDSYFKPFAQTAMQRFGKKLGLIPTSTAYGNAWTQGFTTVWKDMGGDVLGNNAVDYNTTIDYSGAVSKALSEKPDVLFIGGPSQPTALVIKSARDQGFKGGFVIMDQAKFEQMDKILPISALEGATGTVPMTRFNGPGINQFLVAYRKDYGSDRPPNAEVALNYMAMHLLAGAMALAGSVSDPAAIMAKSDDAAKALPAKYQPAELSGITKAGHMVTNFFAVTVDHGEYKRVAIPALL